MSWSQLYQEHLATIEAQAAKIAELETAVRRLRELKVVTTDMGYTICPFCDCDYDYGDNHALDCPWLTSGKLVGE